MGSDSTRTLREELPAHGAWIRRLARSLVRDDASADDLAQQAQLAALEKPGSVRGALAPWLSRVTRNFASRGWRDAARRAAREQAAARGEALPGADESAARIELQRLLVQELSGLDARERHALVRRYFDGWTAARIARETSEPPATVRWRLQRGLRELRARLDRSSKGDGIHWRLALLPLCGKASPWAGILESIQGPIGSGAAAGAIQGASSVKAASQAVAAAALVAAVGVGVWWGVAREGSSSAPARSESEPRAVGLQSAERPAEELAPPQLAPRESLVAESELESEPARPAPAAAPAPRVDGRCVDEAYLPVPRARVRLLAADPEAYVLASAEGLFELELTPERLQSCTLRFEAGGFATRFLEAAPSPEGVTHLGDVVLAPGGQVRGRVYGPTGAPFAGASVAVTLPDLWGSLEAARVSGPRSAQLAGISGGDGRFEIAGVGLGPMRAWAGSEGMRWAVSAPIEVRARETSDEVELSLEPIRDDDRITGIVLTPEGSPVPEARLTGNERAGNSQSSFAVELGATGRFEIEAKPDHVYDLEANDAQGRWAPLQLQGVEPGTRDLELRFLPARWIEVRVLSSDGRAIEEFELAADGEDERRQGLFERGAAGPHAGGDARVLVPSQPFHVRVDARGFAPAEQGPFRPEEAPAGLSFELAPEPGVRGRVLARGRPLAGASVALHFASPQSRIEHQGYPALYTPRPSDRTTTDAEGRFVLRVRDRGTFVVRAEAAGFAAADTLPLPLDPRVGRGDLDLELGRGGAIEGQVLVAAGRDPAGVIVALNRGDASPRTMRSDEQGMFRFERLTPGPWQLSRGAMEIGSESGGTSFSAAKTPTVIPFNCAVHEGQTTYQDLDLRGFEPCQLSGLLLVNGEPAKDWGVVAWPGDKQAMVGAPPATAVAADGRFAFTIDESGPLRLSFTPPAELGGAGAIDARLELHPGANEWQSDFATGRISGRCLSPVPAVEQPLFYNSAEGVKPSCWLPIVPGEDGRYVLPFVPAGKGAIRRLSEQEHQWRWITLVEAEVPARGERVLDVP